MLRRASFSAAAVLGLTLVTAPAGATISEALSLSSLVTRADQVVLVTCESERSLWDDRRRIVTDYELRVEAVVKGRASVGDGLTMRRLGGEIGDLGMRIEGEPRLVPGQRYLLFLRDMGGILRPVGMSQGVLPVRDEGGIRTVLPGGAGLALVSRASGGGLVPAPPALLHPEPWERLRERITAIVDRYDGGR